MKKDITKVFNPNCLYQRMKSIKNAALTVVGSVFMVAMIQLPATAQPQVQPRAQIQPPAQPRGQARPQTQPQPQPRPDSVARARPTFSRAMPDYTKIFNATIVGGYTYSEQMVEGGDGFKLLTRIYLPEGEGPWPVVVTRTPYVYGGRGDNLLLGREYAKRGIGYIQQDCRGKGGSEGFYSPNIYEREDGIALYEWLDAQEWCGSIGIFGSSYTALTGWIVADSLPAKVKAMYLSHYGVDRHVSCFRAGLFRQDIMSGWAIDNAEEDIIRPERKPGQPVGENYYDFYLYRPHVEADVNILGQKLGYYRDWITHTDYNDPYWNQGVWSDLKKASAAVDVPITIVAGQFDHHEEGTLLGYERLAPAVKERSRLILGAWNHSFQPTPTHIPHEHARDFNTTADQFDWFHRILIQNIVPEPEIRVYDIEADRWIQLEEWPIDPDAEKVYYLTSATTGEKDNVFTLSDRAESKGTKVSYVYDPDDPVYATAGETIFTTQARRGSHPQPEAGYRDDVLSFVSAPLQGDMTIAGAVKVVLTVSTDVDDTAFAFTLSEVTPDGKAYNMRNSITTLGYRNDLLGDRQKYKPGKKVRAEIVALPIVWTVKAGNCLRLDIQSSLFPEYAVHSNYAGVWAEQSSTRKACQNIFVGGKKGSYVSLPIWQKHVIN
ncbi:MAG: CocE/NonD family hydrolase [Bacteroidales bacterium]|nr:CocE/NonD family hydrolase [Bacteroidales bacterium]